MSLPTSSPFTVSPFNVPLPHTFSPLSSPPGVGQKGKLTLNSHPKNSYFCREYIEAYFLESPVHSKFINRDALEKFYPVGGVRIEDDILVTDTAYENLTTAPKGEEMLKILSGNGAGQ